MTTNNQLIKVEKEALLARVRILVTGRFNELIRVGWSLTDLAEKLNMRPNRIIEIMNPDKYPLEGKLTERKLKRLLGNPDIFLSSTKIEVGMVLTQRERSFIETLMTD